MTGALVPIESELLAAFPVKVSIKTSWIATDLSFTTTTRAISYSSLDSAAAHTPLALWPASFEIAGS